MRGASLFIAMSLGLAGCNPHSDIDDYITEVRARPAQPIAPLPEVSPFIPLAYQATQQRSPFIQPKPEQGSALVVLKPECRPLPPREKEKLELYGLEHLTMAGTLAKQGQLWALVGTPDGQVIKVGLNRFMGLNHGKVVRIGKDAIELLETIPDGKGCWVTRDTRLAMTNTK
ncbi:pilus assembly protein PilP [Aeromonas simiae]|uniref:pilus assembly protein PilP n=1 Tax=Aeromonas simiae TaxID=218936 RepID=UPI0005AACEFB|nr:pilus assembly protein PilP [Aeromonas simiae]MDO2949095.1 pilus assembly protein PilP [Aeromonas simiae]MDO2953301.1 pilus assembly protein PilP [Aeromonas simiae]MDO2956310.1 pilus assembly protein PilP [Aeromonas simiae]